MSSPATPEPGRDHEPSIAKVNQRAKDIEGKLPRLRLFYQQAKLMLSLVKDYAAGRYREAPYWGIAAVALALLYVLNPADLFPDFIPGLGYLDDAAVIAFCLKLVEKDLEKYQQWLAARSKAGGGPVIDV
ncbi:MAG: YkvA family protein [Prosthecobacter sp.]